MENMASFPDLRPGLRSAKAGSRVVQRYRVPVLSAAFVALLFTAFFAVSELATLRGAKAHDASAFLTRELGPPLDSAPLVRTPAHSSPVFVKPALGGKLEIRNGGLEAASRSSSGAPRFCKTR